MNVIIAGGGTGGHLFPGIAIAQEFLKRDSAHNIVFIGAKNGIESRILPKLKFRLETTTVKGFKGKGIIRQISSLYSLPIACIQAGYFLKRLHTDIVVGLGGYASFPAVAVAITMRTPTVIHEQNSVPGLSNRIIAKFADMVFVSFICL